MKIVIITRSVRIFYIPTPQDENNDRKLTLTK